MDKINYDNSTTVFEKCLELIDMQRYRIKKNLEGAKDWVVSLCEEDAVFKYKYSEHLNTIAITYHVDCFLLNVKKAVKNGIKKLKEAVSYEYGEDWTEEEAERLRSKDIVDIYFDTWRVISFHINGCSSLIEKHPVIIDFKNLRETVERYV